jgi:uncharacterized protein (TIGR03435 family)
VRNCCLPFLFAVAGLLNAQAPAAKPSFEVVSIKENKGASGVPIWTPQRSGNRVILRKVRVGTVINYAWHIDSLWQVSLPGNIPSEWWDIEAKSAGTPDEDTLRLMLQAMLEDRFKVKTHYEQREVDQWDLVISKPGKLKVANSGTEMTVSGLPVRPGAVGIRLESDGGHLISNGCSIARIADSFSHILRAPVANKTNLEGLYQYNILLDENPPNLPSVVNRELGLKLVRSKGQARFL